MKATSEIETGVVATLNKFIGAYEQRDLDSLLASFLPDADVTVIGTGTDEKRIGKVAWMTSDIIFHAKVSGQDINMAARLTVVFEQHGKKWLIAQWHTSFPAAGQKEGESFLSQESS